MNRTLFPALVAAAAFAAAGVHAQQASETTNTPQRAGEASTMSQGVPNAKANATKGSGSGKTAKKTGAGAKSAAAGKASASETSNVPQRAGEASTMTGGAPNKKTTN